MERTIDAERRFVQRFETVGVTGCSTAPFRPEALVLADWSANEAM
jgi:hypothetical protein